MRRESSKPNVVTCACLTPRSRSQRRKRRGHASAHDATAFYVDSNFDRFSHKNPVRVGLGGCDTVGDNIARLWIIESTTCSSFDEIRVQSQYTCATEAVKTSHFRFLYHLDLI